MSQWRVLCVYINAIVLNSSSQLNSTQLNTRRKTQRARTRIRTQNVHTPAKKNYKRITIPLHNMCRYVVNGIRKTVFYKGVSLNTKKREK